MVVLCYEEGNEYAGGGQAGIDRRIDMEYNRKWLDFSYICEFEHFFSSFFFASRLQTTALPVACLSRGSGCLVRVWRL